MQIETNKATSNIDVQLKNRRDTLIKLFDATKNSMKYEKGLLTDITKLRKQNVGTKNYAESSETLDNVSSKLLATVENYPQLQSVAAIRDLMQTADYIEREIASNRRQYNAIVSEFNKDLYAFPANVVATNMKLYNLPFFMASKEDKKDVDLSKLN
jgi:LemA protein